MAEPRECVRCKEIRTIKSRGLCSRCDTYARKHGILNDYPKASIKLKIRYDNCVDCGEYTHIFGKDRCRTCHQRWYMSFPENKKRHAEREKQRRVNNHERIRELDRHRGKTEKRREWSKRYQKKYYQKNPEVFKRSSKKWEDKNPGIWRRYNQIRRARENELPHTLTDSEWEEIVKKYHYLCIYCGCSDKRLTQDHWIPITKGGGYTAENIVPACQSCNSRKGTMTGEEFMEFLDNEEWASIKMEIEKICAF